MIQARYELGCFVRDLFAVFARSIHLFWQGQLDDASRITETIAVMKKDTSKSNACFDNEACAVWLRKKGSQRPSLGILRDAPLHHALVVHR